MVLIVSFVGTSTYSGRESSLRGSRSQRGEQKPVCPSVAFEARGREVLKKQKETKKAQITIGWRRWRGGQREQVGRFGGRRKRRWQRGEGSPCRQSRRQSPSR